MVQDTDEIDKRLLRALQKDATPSVETLAETVHLSRNACWRRIKRMEETGLIRGRVALLDAERLGFGLAVFVMVRATEHSADWLGTFRQTVRAMPEITGAYRMSGELDYLLKVQVDSVKSYDRFYQRLVSKIKAADISASFVMEEIKETTELPV